LSEYETPSRDVIETSQSNISERLKKKKNIIKLQNIERKEFQNNALEITHMINSMIDIEVT